MHGYIHARIVLPGKEVAGFMPARKEVINLLLTDSAQTPSSLELIYENILIQHNLYK
jgi:hypothetical protein